LKAKFASLVENAEKEPPHEALVLAARVAREGWLPDPVNLSMNVRTTVLEEGKGGSLRVTCP
jgi:hypothetical protein